MWCTVLQAQPADAAGSAAAGSTGSSSSSDQSRWERSAPTTAKAAKRRRRGATAPRKPLLSSGPSEKGPVTQALHNNNLGISPSTASAAVSGSDRASMWHALCAAAPRRRLALLQETAGVTPKLSASDIWDRLVRAGATGAASSTDDLLSRLPSMPPRSFGGPSYE